MDAKTLSTMSLSDLTAVYNKFAAKPIKKFSCSRDAAIAKVLPLLPTKTTSTKKQGIGHCIVAALKDGMSPQDTLAMILKQFPTAKTSIKCVYWYNSKIKTGDIE